MKIIWFFLVFALYKTSLGVTLDSLEAKVQELSDKYDELRILVFIISTIIFFITILMVFTEWMKRSVKNRAGFLLAEGSYIPDFIVLSRQETV